MLSLRVSSKVAGVPIQLFAPCWNPGVGCGIGVEQRQTVGADAIGRDDVAGEAAALIRGGARQPGEGVADAAHRTEVGIRRVQQFAEVAVAHRQ